MVDVKQVADAADMIVNGYAFTRYAEGLPVFRDGKDSYGISEL